MYSHNKLKFTNHTLATIVLSLLTITDECIFFATGPRSFEVIYHMYEASLKILKVNFFTLNLYCVSSQS